VEDCAGSHGDYDDPQWEDTENHRCSVGVQETDWEAAFGDEGAVSRICEQPTVRYALSGDAERVEGTVNPMPPRRRGSCLEMCEGVQDFINTSSSLYEWTGHDQWDNDAWTWPGGDVIMHWDHMDSSWLWAHEGYHGWANDFEDELGADGAGNDCHGEYAY
jgi:hypothetical protein